MIRCGAVRLWKPSSWCNLTLKIPLVHFGLENHVSRPLPALSAAFLPFGWHEQMGEVKCPARASPPHGLNMVSVSHRLDPSSSFALCVGTHNSLTLGVGTPSSLTLSVGGYPCGDIGADFSSSLMTDSCTRALSCARASSLLRPFCRLIETTSATSVAMRNVPRDTPIPAPTAIVFEVSWQGFASTADAHVEFEAAAAVLTALVVRTLVLRLDTTALNVTVSVVAAAWVGNPSAEAVVVESAAVLLQQFGSALSTRQQ